VSGGKSESRYNVSTTDRQKLVGFFKKPSHFQKSRLPPKKPSHFQNAGAPSSHGNECDGIQMPFVTPKKRPSHKNFKKGNRANDLLLIASPIID
jgi:hypothetical protein